MTHVPHSLSLAVSEGDFGGVCDWGNCNRDTEAFGLAGKNGHLGDWLPMCGPCADGTDLRNPDGIPPTRVIWLDDIR